MKLFKVRFRPELKSIKQVPNKVFEKIVLCDSCSTKVEEVIVNEIPGLEVIYQERYEVVEEVENGVCEYCNSVEEPLTPEIWNKYLTVIGEKNRSFKLDK